MGSPTTLLQIVGSAHIPPCRVRRVWEGERPTAFLRPLGSSSVGVGVAEVLAWK